MIVAVDTPLSPPPQHRAIWGHLASSHTVFSLSDLREERMAAYCSPPPTSLRSHGGSLRLVGVHEEEGEGEEADDDVAVGELVERSVPIMTP